jgi:hypothetical protein
MAGGHIPRVCPHGWINAPPKAAIRNPTSCNEQYCRKHNVRRICLGMELRHFSFVQFDDAARYSVPSEHQSALCIENPSTLFLIFCKHQCFRLNFARFAVWSTTLKLRHLRSQISRMQGEYLPGHPPDGAQSPRTPNFPKPAGENLVNDRIPGTEFKIGFVPYHLPSNGQGALYGMLQLVP